MPPDLLLGAGYNSSSSEAGSMPAQHMYSHDVQAKASVRGMMTSSTAASSGAAATAAHHRRADGQQQVLVEEGDEWQVVSSSDSGEAAGMGASALASVPRKMDTRLITGNPDTSSEEGQQQQQQQQVQMLKQQGVGSARGMSAELQYQSTSSEEELLPEDRRKGDGMEVDAGMTTDTSSYGADGQDEQGGLPEGFEQERRIALVWDERMELHEEGKVVPHPERPDRVRAVMSRILASNLAGT
ncbi:hypothetical protein DUNSADRAFT_17276 [Dunaliella salina]|uniref:Histone deacetylase n=1 Tax=Dunaliella salina TaxID=3046 RepID=A0ABQ7G235_DUNSA|nr:hypothetical protein DUNSADRAFT_17276 [Dunaliella salina]|eukprot:KAF5828660.1 hypothetical protein DUNSADRAFT_17276 [Dunaliella salina]